MQYGRRGGHPCVVLRVFLSHRFHKNIRWFINHCAVFFHHRVCKADLIRRGGLDSKTSLCYTYGSTVTLVMHFFFRTVALKILGPMVVPANIFFQPSWC